MRNPFRFGSALNPEAPSIRRPDLERCLRETALGCSRALLLGGRRMGKTSAVMGALHALPLVRVDCRDLRSMEDFIERVCLALELEGGRLGDRWNPVRDSLVSLRASLGGSRGAGKGVGGEYLVSLLELLNQFGRLFPQATLFLDEIQGLMVLGSGGRARDGRAFIEGALREQPDLAFVLAGSTALRREPWFQSFGGLFERTGLLRDLEPISEKAFAEFLVGQFALDKRILSLDTAAALLSISGSCPDDVQRLAHVLWSVTASGQAVERLHLREAVNGLLDQGGQTLEECLAGLTSNQERVVFALATLCEAPVATQAFVQRAGLKHRAIAAATAKALAEAAVPLLELREGKYGFKDRYLYLGLVRRLVRRPHLQRVLGMGAGFRPGLEWELLLAEAGN